MIHGETEPRNISECLEEFQPFGRMRTTTITALIAAEKQGEVVFVFLAAKIRTDVLVSFPLSHSTESLAHHSTSSPP